MWPATVRSGTASSGTDRGGIWHASPACSRTRSGFRRAGPAASGLSPEDIVALPGTKWLVAGALPKTDAGTRGGLSLIDTGNPAVNIAL